MKNTKSILLLSFLWLTFFTNAQIITIGSTGDYPNLEAAVSFISAGDTVLLQAETFADGSQFLSDLTGTAGAPIVIMAENEHQTIFQGGTEAIHLINCVYVELNGLIFQGQTGNGVNIDDGGDYDTPSHHITIRNCIFRDMAASGNNDLLKMSGVDDFLIENCSFTNGGTGGSGIDFVGCHSGIVQDCYFDNAGTSGIQNKGGTQFIRIQRNIFKNMGQRALNLGGSTGLQYFRPPLPNPIVDAFEAADLDVFSNIFIGSWSPIAYVGCVRVKVYNNTFYQPENWAIRILQETTEDGFLACADNEFKNNIVYLANDITEVNIGPNTAAETFQFANNLWFNASSNSWSPNLPVVDVNQVIANPLFQNAAIEDFNISFNSPAVAAGVHLDMPEMDFEQSLYHNPPSIGAFEGNISDLGPFTVKENRVWTIVSLPVFDPISTTRAYRFSGDTTINNVTYKKLFSTQDSLLTDDWNEVVGTFLREDALHRVFIYRNGIERILYDFSLDIGDTFEVFHEDSSCELSVYTFDNINLNNGDFRKRITLVKSDEINPTAPVFGYKYWVQGIGSLSSLTDYGGSCFTDFGLQLLCFIDDGETLYSSSNDDTCFIQTTGVDDLDANRLKIYPNPANQIVNIEIDAAIEKITLLGINGREIKAKMNTKSLDVNGLAKGIYLLKIDLRDGGIIRRLLVID